jgi:hypothetical protein
VLNYKSFFDIFSSNQSTKRFKSHHSSFPPPSSSTTFRASIPNYGPNRHQPPFNQQFHHSQPPPSLAKPILPSARPLHYPIPPSSQIYPNPTQNHIPFYNNYQTNQPIPYYTSNNAYYQLNSHNQLQVPPEYYAYHQQQQQQHQLHQHQHQQLTTQPPPSSSYTNEVYHPAYQYQSSVIQSNTIKTEPTEQSHYLIQSNTNNIMTTTTPYFTNSVPFKQEPVDNLNLNSRSSSVTNSSSENSNKKSANEDSNAFSIVTHLLKDKQILSQLEKVAQFQSFRHPNQNGSLYQGTWNFNSSSSSSSS